MPSEVGNFLKDLVPKRARHLIGGREEKENILASIASYIDNIEKKPAPHQLGIGGAAGLVTGYLFTKGSKATAAILGVSLITFQALRWLLPGPQHNRRLDFKDKTVLITGASTGLGRTLAQQLHRKGAKLILTARSIDKLKELCEELKASAEGAHEPVYRYLDLAEPEGLEELVGLAPNGKIDVLINNAGLSMRGSVKDTPVEVQRQLMEVNFFGQVAVTRTLLDAIPDDGAVIVTSSVQGRISIPYRSGYAASKHALQAFFDSLRCEERPKLHILVVSAGYINTGFGKKALGVSGRPVEKEDANQAKGYSSEYVSSRIIRAAESRQTELILAPLSARFGIFLRWFWPNLYFYLAYKRGLKDEYAKKSE